MKFTGCVYLWPNIDKSVYPGDGTKCGKGGTAPHDSTCPYLYPSQHGGWGVGCGIPPVMPWDVTWIANQYDGFADCPVNFESVPELDRRVTIFGLDVVPPWFDNGVIWPRLRTGKESTHKSDPQYYLGTLDGADTVTYTDPAQPTQKYRWRMKYPMPYAYPKRMIRYWARAMDLDMRATWDEGWERPVTLPVPDYATLPSWVPFKP